MNAVAADVPSPPPFDRAQRRLSVGMTALVAMIAFEAMAVTAAMPTVAAALDGMSLYAFAFGGALAASLVGMVIAGGWADRRSPAWPCATGALLFLCGLVVAGSAATMAQIVSGRIVQGFGGGMLTVALHASVGRCYADQQRAQVFALFAAAWVLPALAGPALAAALVHAFGWPWVFLAVALAVPPCMLLVVPQLFDLHRRSPSRPRATGGVRWPWAVLAAAGALLLHQVASDGSAAIWQLALAVPLVTIAAWRLLPRGTLRLQRGLPTVIALRGFLTAAFFGAEVYVPLLLSAERGLSPAAAGVALTAGAVCWSIGALWQRRAPSAERAASMRRGLTMIALGTAAVANVLLPQVPVAVAVVGWAVAGFGIGLVSPVLSLLVLQLSPAEQQATNASAIQLCDALATACALAAGGSAFMLLSTHGQPQLAYLACFGLSIAIALAGAWASGRVMPRTEAC